VQPDLPAGFQVEDQPSLAHRAYDKAGDYLDTGIKALTAPFEPVGEAIRGARMGEPLQLATAADPRGFRAPSILQKYVPSLRTPEPPSDPIAETYGGLRGITQAAAHLPQGLGAVQAGAQEIERPRTGMDIIPEVGFGLMLGKVGNAPFDAALEAGGRLARPLLRGVPKVVPQGFHGPQIEAQAPLALPAPAEGPGFTMMDQPNLANTVEAEVYNPATGTTEIVHRPMTSGEMAKPVGATPGVSRETPPPPVEPAPVRPPQPEPHIPEIAANQGEPFTPELPPGFALEESAPMDSRIKEMGMRDRETMQEITDLNKSRAAAHGQLPEGFQLAEGSGSEVTPKRASISGEASGALETSETSQPPRAQAEPFQVSAKTVVPSETKRASAPSTTAGPATNSSLGSIDPSSNRLITQTHSDVNGLIRQARESEPILVERLNNVAREIPGSSFRGARTKGGERLAEKLGSRPPNTVGDYLGGRFSVDNAADAETVIQKLEAQGLRVIDKDNFLERPRGGYRAIHLQVEMPNGLTAEVQILPKELADVQNEAHHAYNVFRSPSVSAAEYNAAKGKSEAIFDAAWNKYQARIGGSAAAPAEELAGQVRDRAAKNYAGDVPFEPQEVPIKSISTDEGRFQPRASGTNQERVDELAKSIQEKGFTKPLTLWEDPADKKLYVLSGHHRLEASEQLGRESVPANVIRGIPESQAKEIAANSNKAKASGAFDEYAKTYDSESVSEARPAEKGGGNFRDYLRQNDAIQLKNEKGMELWQASKDSNEFYLVEGDRFQTFYGKSKAQAQFNQALDEGTIFNRERAARNFKMDNPPGEAAPGATAAETPAAQKTLGQLIKDLGRDLAQRKGSDRKPGRDR
jgi:hypothetical protein